MLYSRPNPPRYTHALWPTLYFKDTNWTRTMANSMLNSHTNPSRLALHIEKSKPTSLFDEYLRMHLVLLYLTKSTHHCTNLKSWLDHWKHDLDTRDPLLKYEQLYLLFLYEDNYSTTRGTVIFSSFTQPLHQKNQKLLHSSFTTTNIKRKIFLNPGWVESVQRKFSL